MKENGHLNPMEELRVAVRQILRRFQMDWKYDH
jgi:hypothetical protein